MEKRDGRSLGFPGALLVTEIEGPPYKTETPKVQSHQNPFALQSRKPMRGHLNFPECPAQKERHRGLHHLQPRSHPPQRRPPQTQTSTSRPCLPQSRPTGPPSSHSSSSS